MRHPSRLIIVVSAAGAAQANSKAAEVDREGGQLTFTAPLSASGSRPATHYWCSWALRADRDASIRAKLAALVSAGHVSIHDGTMLSPGQVLTTLGLQRVNT